MKAVDFTGTVSHRRTRPEDIIPAFMQVLETYWPEKAEELQEAYNWNEAFDYESDDCDCLIEELFDALDEIAPTGYFFGAHPADYGFWPIEDM